MEPLGASSASRPIMNRACVRTTARKTLTKWCADESGRCKASSRLDQLNAFSSSTPPFPTPSISSATSFPAKLSACSGPRRRTNGTWRLQRRSRVKPTLVAARFEFHDKAPGSCPRPCHTLEPLPTWQYPSQGQTTTISSGVGIFQLLVGFELCGLRRVLTPSLDKVIPKKYQNRVRCIREHNPDVEGKIVLNATFLSQAPEPVPILCSSSNH
jgi:hypothetical protein